MKNKQTKKGMRASARNIWNWTRTLIGAVYGCNVLLVAGDCTIYNNNCLECGRRQFRLVNKNALNM